MLRLQIYFAEHVDIDRRASVTSQIAAYGMVEGVPASGSVSVEIRRVANLDQLKEQLTAWERFGLLTWSSDENSN